jgi:hypothetical protein
MFDRYLGWLTNGGFPPDHYQFVDTSGLGFAREWGMKTAPDDARRVVRVAARGGREVFLGGHSLGASLTAPYAANPFADLFANGIAESAGELTVPTR